MSYKNFYRGKCPNFARVSKVRWQGRNILKGIKLKQLIKTILVVLASIFMGLLVGELFLRFGYHRYQYVVSPLSEVWNAERYFSLVPNSVSFAENPDSGKKHWVIYNNLGLRQHRDFDERLLEKSQNFAYFGDSFIENRRIEAQFSISEIVDFVLNEKSGPVNVLNFGVDGYGPDQEFIYYSGLKAKDRLKFVFYFFCSNDLQDISNNKLFTLGPGGDLIPQKAPTQSRTIKLFSQFHMTYLVIEAYQKLTAMIQNQAQTSFPTNLLDQQVAETHAKLQKNLKSSELQKIRHQLRLKKVPANWDLLLSILDHWQREVQSHGGQFFVVLLPRQIEADSEIFFPEQFEVINLRQLMIKDNENFDLKGIQFKRDSHWNEKGNLMAAYYLIKTLSKRKVINSILEENLRSLFMSYCQAFNRPDLIPSGWNLKWVESKSGLAVRKKYLFLESILHLIPLSGP